MGVSPKLSFLSFRVNFPLNHDYGRKSKKTLKKNAGFERYTISFSESLPFSAGEPCEQLRGGGVYHHVANPSNYPPRKLTVRT